jgi:hypothetical protein
MLEVYGDEADARDSYQSIYRSNEDHDGVEVMDGLGDEAYFHSDSENFCFILVRKANRMLRMKVKKLTSRTSLPEFHAVTREITARM